PELSADGEALLASLDDAVPDDVFELDASVRELIARRGALELDLARMLRIFRMLGLHRHIGFASFNVYAAERLGISASRANFLARLDRRLYDFPEIRRALREGRIGSVAALELTRVARRGLSESEWVARAARRTVLRLREEITWVERRKKLYRWEDVPMPPAPGRLPNILDTLTRDWLRAKRGACPSSAAKRGASPSDHAEQTFAHPDAAAVLRDTLTTIGDRDEGPLVRVEFPLREPAVELWTEARRRIRAATGDSWIPDREILKRAAVEFLVTYLPVWFEELAGGNPIAVRERFRCAIPGCTVHGGAPHHLRYRSQGGSDEEDNLLNVCYTHHIEGQHRGRIRVHGRAPDDLVFELGIRPDGTPLEMFVNEDRVVGCDLGSREPHNRC
ncbi:MAG: HNH endonuclease signature motif containing protein, partial [Acidobacteriota bacterium]|nr:HNH endonuclease signature motif containing protein [Acidobacteriota bacterium]